MTLAQMKSTPDVLSQGADRLIERVGEVIAAAERVLVAAKAGVRIKGQEGSGIGSAQHETHGLAWLATTVEGIRQMQHWAAKLKSEGRLGEMQQLLAFRGRRRICRTDRRRHSHEPGRDHPRRRDGRLQGRTVQMKTSIDKLNNILGKIDRGEGTLGALINDSSLHDQLKSPVGGSQRKNHVKSLMRTSIEKD